MQVCARRLHLSHIRVAKVGGGEFTPPGIHFGLLVHYPCMRMLQKYFPELTIIQEYFPRFRVPQSLPSIEHELPYTLFINAWDPWSIVGNGNNGDTSLDGYWGRISASALLASPFINNTINYVSTTLTSFN